MFYDRVLVVAVAAIVLLARAVPIVLTITMNRIELVTAIGTNLPGYEEPVSSSDRVAAKTLNRSSERRLPFAVRACVAT